MRTPAPPRTTRAVWQRTRAATVPTVSLTLLPQAEGGQGRGSDDVYPPPLLCIQDVVYVAWDEYDNSSVVAEF